MVVISPEDLETLIDRAVRKALSESGAARPRDEWIPAKACSLPRTTLVRLRKEKSVRSCKVGRETYVHAGDVRTWLEARAERPESEPSNVVELPSDPFETARARARARRSA